MSTATPQYILQTQKHALPNSGHHCTNINCFFRPVSCEVLQTWHTIEGTPIPSAPASEPHINTSTHMMFDAMIALLSFPRVISTRLSKSRMTDTRNLLSWSSCIVPLMDPMAQQRVHSALHCRSAGLWSGTSRIWNAHVQVMTSSPPKTTAFRWVIASILDQSVLSYQILTGH